MIDGGCPGPDGFRQIPGKAGAEDPVHNQPGVFAEGVPFLRGNGRRVQDFRRQALEPPQVFLRQGA